MPKTFVWWFLSFRPVAKQERHSCLNHQSPAWGIHTPAKQGQKPQDREVGFDRLLPIVLQTENWEKARQPFSRNNGQSPATDLKEKNRSFRKRLPPGLLLSCYFYTATRADLILTHQTLGISQSSRVSSSDRETQALRSQAAELPARGLQRAWSLLP